MWPTAYYMSPKLIEYVVCRLEMEEAEDINFISIELLFLVILLFVHAKLINSQN